VNRDLIAFTPERALASAAAELTWVQLPAPVVVAIRRLFLDWVASALAGSTSIQVTRLSQAAARGGLGIGGSPCAEGEKGTATALPRFAQAPALVAALLNGASSHVEEMDDLHNESIYHPGTCVFPAALAVAESEGAGPRDFLTAAVAGYEVSLRVGQALGSEHYRYFHTTGTAGTVGAAVAAGHLLGLDTQEMLSAIGSAGTQAAGLWQFLADGAMSKQLHTAKAAFNGVLSAYLAGEGFTGSAEILLGEKGLLPGMARSEGTGGITDDGALRRRQRQALMEGLEEVPGSPLPDYGFAAFKTPEVSIKYHASCRHTHPAVDALLLIMEEHGLAAERIRSIHAHVNTAAFDLLKDATASGPWAAKFSIPFCLAQAALCGSLGVDSFSVSALEDPRLVELMNRVTTDVDPSLDADYPRRWVAWVDVETVSGSTFQARVDAPKGDPDNALSAEELEAKFRLLSRRLLDDESVGRLLATLAALMELGRMSELLRGFQGPVDG
jgi:2-methylcitrate dehydratase PrpD